MVQKVFTQSTKTVFTSWIQILYVFIMWKLIVEFIIFEVSLVECADRLKITTTLDSVHDSQKRITSLFKHEFLTYKNLYRLVNCINRLYIQLLIAKCCLSRYVSTAVLPKRSRYLPLELIYILASVILHQCILSTHRPTVIVCKIIITWKLTVGIHKFSLYLSLATTLLLFIIN